MEGFVNVVTVLVSVLVGFSSASTMMFSARDVYSELNAFGQVYVGRYGEELSRWSASQDDPSTILVKLLEVRFRDTNGQLVHKATIGKIPDPYEYYFDEDFERTVVFQFHTSEYEEYQNIDAIGRVMATVFPEAKIQMTLGVYILMSPGVVNKGNTLQQSVERGQVRVELEMSRTESCVDCQQVSEMELDIWIKGEGPVSKAGHQYYTEYGMGSRSLLRLPHQVTSNGSPRGISVDSRGEERVVNMTLKTPLPNDSSAIQYSMTINPAREPEVVTEPVDTEEYMDQQPSHLDQSTNPDAEQETAEMKKTGNNASNMQSSTTILILTFTIMRLWKYFL